MIQLRQNDPPKKVLYIPIHTTYRPIFVIPVIFKLTLIMPIVSSIFCQKKMEIQRLLLWNYMSLMFWRPNPLLTSQLTKADMSHGGHVI